MRVLSTSNFRRTISWLRRNCSSILVDVPLLLVASQLGWGRWVKALSKEDKLVRQARFIALWLSKFLFGELLGYGVKSAFFPLAIRIARGISYPLALMFLGHLYSQLDLVHADELEGNSCYTITSSIHCTMLQIFV